MDERSAGVNDRLRLTGRCTTAFNVMSRQAPSVAVPMYIDGASLTWAAGNPVSVSARYDGRWAIEATTKIGACPSTLSLEMNVAQGEATVSSSILYSVSGGISQAGAVRGTTATAATTALVTGRVKGNRVGRGSWRTQEGSLLTCNGSWPQTGHEASRTKTWLTRSPTEGSPPAKAVSWMAP